MDPPSAQLVRRLASLGLCTPRDLNQCRRRVKSLARDLPTFDSVWVDALVQSRRLTPFQAHWLESDAPERLAAGPCVLVDRLGSDGRFTHYRGRLRDTHQAVTVTVADHAPDVPTAALDRLRSTIDGLRGFAHPGLLIPSGCGLGETGMIVVSPWLDGNSLHDLLVRRGRFSAEAVTAIGRQLVEALATIEQRGNIHGDIRMRNVRLTNRGQSVLVNAGLVPALWPELTIHARLPPDCFDAIAPELIGTGATPDARTDLYALGCVLWELLAGRPPFPHGDPLAKLAAHQSLAVPDVRTWAPDTPAVLSAMIAAMTAQEPDKRPANFAEVRQRLGNAGRGTRRELRAFYAGFGRPAVTPQAARRHGLLKRTAATAGLLLMALAGVGLLDTGVRNELLSIAVSGPGILREHVFGSADVSEAGAIDTNAAFVEPARLMPFPAQIDHGVLTLDRRGPYSPGEIAARGPLRIRGMPGVRPVVLVGERPLRVWAEQLILENIEFRREDANAVDAVPLAVIETQSVGVKQCTFVMSDARPSAALVWSPLDNLSSTPQRVLLSDSLFLGAGTAIDARGAPGSVEVENVLKRGAGPLLLLSGDGTGPGATAVELRHVTLRDSGGVVRLAARTRSAVQTALTMEDCVLDIPASSGGLIEIAAEFPPPGWSRQIRITGENSLVRPDIVIAALAAGPSGRIRALPTDQMSIDGLLTSEIVFAGATADPRDSAVDSRLGHGRSIQAPGIDPQVFADGDGPYNSAASNTPPESTRVRAP